MYRFCFRSGVLFLSLACLLAPVVTAQQCPLPPSPFRREANIFSAEQEMYLGEAAAQHLEHEFLVIKDDEINRPLREVGERLLRALPPDGLRYQFLLFDQPVANAWGLPGGRIYLSRKLVAFAHDENELAGILAHEIGHIYTHQQAIDFTRWFRQSLRVTQVAGRDDIFNRYHQLIESREKGGHSEKREAREQLVADQLALYAMARAGYNPRAYADIWDRLAETKGKTGGFWSDFFGATSPESKRLREMLKVASAMPTACVDQRSAAAEDEFRAWQSGVIVYSRSNVKEQLQGVLLKRQLEPPLQSELTHLRFSPDGKYLLAQDDGGITVLSREPLQAVFHVEAEEALPAQFSPDSQSVVFHTRRLRVESWSVRERKRNWVRELVLRRGCYQTALSPDGKYLVCYRRDFGLTLLEVDNGTVLVDKKDFFVPDLVALIFLFIGQLELGADSFTDWLNMGFSPDGNYVIVARDQALLAYDLTRRASFPLANKIKDGVRRGFAFLGSDRIAVIAGDRAEKSAVLRFPSGERLAPISLGRQQLAGASDARYLLLRPIKEHPVGVFDWAQNKVLMGNHRPGLDVYDGIAASEARDGQVALSKISATEARTVASVQLPVPPLAGLRITELSEDLNLLALSLGTRGAIFDLQQGKRLFSVRGFRGAYFADDGVVYADFPKYQETARTVARLKIGEANIDVGPPLADNTHASQSGAYLLVRKPGKKGETWRDFTLEVQDVRSGAVLWSKALHGEAPRMYPNPGAGSLTFMWQADAAAAKEAARASAKLRNRFDTIRKGEDAYYLEVYDLRTGQQLGQLLIDTKDAFDLRNAMAAGNFVAVTDNQNRVLLYSLKSGDELAKVFGGPAQLSSTGLLSVAGEGGEVTLYDAATMGKRGQYLFPSEPAYLQFSKDGKRMLALLKNQTVYVLDLSTTATAQAK